MSLHKILSHSTCIIACAIFNIVRNNNITEIFALHIVSPQRGVWLVLLLTGPNNMNGAEGNKQLAKNRSALLQPPCEFILHNYAEIKRDEREW